jgi:ribosomal-protein-alanine N-acetyltransferase
MKIETGRLVLSSAIHEDAPLLQDLFSRAEVVRFLPPGPPVTLDSARGMVERRIKLEADLGYAPLIIRTKDHGEFVGSGGLLPVQDRGEAEIAYHLLPSAWGRGYATEAGTAILGFGLRDLRLGRILGVAYPENVPSWKVLEKIGMQYQGLQRYHDIDGLRMYAAMQETWGPPPDRTQA